MADILQGVAVAQALSERLTAKTTELKAQGIMPTLAIVRVGEREDDIAYERGALKRMEKIGVTVEQVILPGTISEDTLLSSIKILNEKVSVHGVLLFRPLPEQINEERVRNALAPEKDIDGITDLSLAGVFTSNSTGFAPCTAQACMEILDFYGIDCKGKRAVVIGRSLVAGKPVAMILLDRHATVTVCHSRSQDIEAICREADIIVACVGRARMLDASFFSKGQTIIDVGINIDECGSLCGDVDFAQAEQIVSALTPVPGGVGAVTTSVLAKHVIEAATRTMR